MTRRACIFLAAIVVAVTTIPTIGRREGAGASALLVQRVRKTFQPNKGKIFALVIGNDAREGNPANARADAIHLVGVNTKTMKGGILNFPRDSYVSFPGGGSGKINEALTRGGPRLLVKTVERLTGIRIDYWAMTGFQGFRAIIRKLRGVRITIKRGMYDPGGSGARIKPGTKWLSAEPALAFVRTRKTIPGGDLGRTANQGRFLLALLRKLRFEVGRRPTRLFHWIRLTQQHTKLDASTRELFRLGVLASQLRPKHVRNITVPASVGSAGGASVVFISPAARSIYRRFRRTGSL